MVKLPIHVDFHLSIQELTKDLKSQVVSNVALPLHTKHCPVHTVVELPLSHVTENANEEPGLLYANVPRRKKLMLMSLIAWTTLFSTILHCLM